MLPPTPEAAATFFGVWKLGAILLSMSVLYGDDAIEHRLSDSGAKLLVTDPGNAPRFDAGRRGTGAIAPTLSSDPSNLCRDRNGIRSNKHRLGDLEKTPRFIGR